MSSLDRPRALSPASMPASPGRGVSRRRLIGLAAALLLAGSTAGCFKPMYAESSQPDGVALQDKLSEVEVVFAAGRVGNEVRNDLIFALTGGAGNPASAPYRLVLTVNDSTAQTYINSVSGLPEEEMVTVDVHWQLFAAGDDKKPVMQAQSIGKASANTGYQRFARNRALRDAQNRASSMAADGIRGQLATYFTMKSRIDAASGAAPAPAATPPKT